jgi:hypothetical protein
MASFNLDNYETVEERLAKFWHDHPEGRVLTSVYYYDENRIVVKAEIYFDRQDERPVSTGFAEEIRGSSPVNRTSHVENADTSAIGRGLANCGYQSKAAPRPSRQEMEKVQRYGNDKSVEQVVDMLKDSFGDGSVVTEEKSVQIKDPGAAASPKQLGMIRAIMREQGMNKEDSQFYTEAIIGRRIEKLDEITKGEASLIITDLRK